MDRYSYTMDVVVGPLLYYLQDKISKQDVGIAMSNSVALVVCVCVCMYVRASAYVCPTPSLQPDS